MCGMGDRMKGELHVNVMSTFTLLVSLFCHQVPPSDQHMPQCGVQRRILRVRSPLADRGQHPGLFVHSVTDDPAADATADPAPNPAPDDGGPNGGPDRLEAFCGADNPELTTSAPTCVAPTTMAPTPVQVCVSQNPEPLPTSARLRLQPLMQATSKRHLQFTHRYSIFTHRYSHTGQIGRASCV